MPASSSPSSAAARQGASDAAADHPEFSSSSAAATQQEVPAEASNPPMQSISYKSEEQQASGECSADASNPHQPSRSAGTTMSLRSRGKQAKGHTSTLIAQDQQHAKRVKRDSSHGQATLQPKSSPAGTASVPEGCSTPATPRSALPEALQRRASSPIAVLRPPSASRTVQRMPLGPSVADTTEMSPSRLALAICDHMCPAPSSKPGQEPMVPTMGILAVATLLRLAGHLRRGDLNVFSQEMIPESSLDKEFSNAGASA